MASDMWDAARQLQGASFYASAATATGGELQEYLLKSTYWREPTDRRQEQRAIRHGSSLG